MEKYMIGDEFGNMWNEENNEFFCNKGTIFNTEKSVNQKLDELAKSEKYYGWQLKKWTLTIK